MTLVEKMSDCLGNIFQITVLIFSVNITSSRFTAPRGDVDAAGVFRSVEVYAEDRK